VRIDAEGLAAARGGEPVDALAARLLPGGGAERVAAVVAADIAGGVPANVSPAERALGLVLGSPEFQRR
jgi:hypothetical protein